MPETALTTTTAPTKWSMTGAAVTMAAVDNASGNSFPAASDILLIVQNTSGGPLTFQLTSTALTSGPGAGRTGNVSQSLAAGEIRVFRLAKNGWANSSNLIVTPTGLNTGLKVGVVVLGA